MRLLVIALITFKATGAHQRPSVAGRHRKPSRTSQLLDSPVFWWVVVIITVAILSWFKG